MSGPAQPTLCSTFLPDLAWSSLSLASWTFMYSLLRVCADPIIVGAPSAVGNCTHYAEVFLAPPFLPVDSAVGSSGQSGRSSEVGDSRQGSYIEQRRISACPRRPGRTTHTSWL